MEKESKAERPRKSEGSEHRNQTAYVADSIQHESNDGKADSTVNEETVSFEGFEPANTTPVPDILFDRLLSKLNGAELKALLYIIRRTWGFKKTEDTISFSQFQHGITTREGKVLDEGCGVRDRTTLVKALNSLVKKGFVKRVKAYNEETKEHEATHYSIRFKSDNEGSGQNLPGVVGKPDKGSGQNPPTPSGQSRTRGSGQTRRTRNSNTRNSIQVSLSSSQNAQNDDVGSDEIPSSEKPAKIELTPEQKTRARALKVKIEDRCGVLTNAGPNIAENKAIAKLIQTYCESDTDDVEHYLIHCHYKWSKPDFKYHIRGNTILDEMEPTLKLFAENPKLRDAKTAPKPASQQTSTMTYRQLPPMPRGYAASGVR